MTKTQTFSVTLDAGLADRLRLKISDGTFQSESAAVAEALTALFEREQTVEACCRVTWPPLMTNLKQTRREP